MNGSVDPQADPPGGKPASGGEPAEQVRQLQRDLAAARASRDELQRTLAAERTQLARSFELFERDRRMLGFEIHDGIVQDLTAALMYLQAGLNELSQRQVAAPDSLTECERIVTGCIEEARRIIAGLQPPQLAQYGLGPAIEALAEEVRQRGVAEVVVRIDQTLGNLSPPLEVAVYRSVQESLNNVWQHSQARRAEVVIERREGNIQILVRDNGIGFTSGTASKHHYGLLGIRERAHLFGGQASINSQPGQGTTVQVTLPLS
jgi:signal transduction histidine kinase